MQNCFDYVMYLHSSIYGPSLLLLYYYCRYSQVQFCFHWLKNLFSSFVRFKCNRYVVYQLNKWVVMNWNQVVACNNLRKWTAGHKTKNTSEMNKISDWWRVCPFVWYVITAPDWNGLHEFRRVLHEWRKTAWRSSSFLSLLSTQTRRRRHLPQSWPHSGSWES